MANIYKTFTKAELDSKASYSASESQNTKVNTIVSKFVELFKVKHLS